MPSTPRTWSVLAASCGAVFLIVVLALAHKDQRVLANVGDAPPMPPFAPLQDRLAPSPPPVPLPDRNTRLKDTLAILEKPALAGSANAACRLSQDIRRCATRSDVLSVAEDLAKFPAPPGGGIGLAATLVDQADADSAFCSEVGQHQLSQGYLFQTIAANSGKREYARWLVFSPALSQQDYLQELDKWENYRQRSEKYVAEAMKARDGQDLMLLLLVHAPKNIRLPRPPYRIDDFRTFLALMRVAEQNRVAVPIELHENAERLRSTLTPEETRSVDERHAVLSRGWRFEAPMGLPYQQYGKYNAASLCKG